MRIDFFTNHIGDGWSPDDIERFLGGNEEALVRLSEELVNLGHEITVFTSLRSGQTERNGVRYKERHAFRAADPRDVIICLKDRSPLFDPSIVGRKVYWCVDVEREPWDTSVVDDFVVLARYHHSRLSWLTHPRVTRIPYGYDMERFRPSAERDSNLALYTTSPDRGLQTLLHDWAIVKRYRPDLRLLVTYKWPVVTHPTYRVHMAQLKIMLRQPGIEVRTVLEEEMIELFCTAQYWVHPLNNPDSDLIGFSAMKAELGGCNLVIPGPIGGFADAVASYIPYGEWVAGKNTKANNPHITVRPVPWAQIAIMWLNSLGTGGKGQVV